MDDSAADRLRRTIEQSAFHGAADLARRLGWTASTVRSHTNGTRGITSKRAEAYSKVLGVSPEWLLYGKEDPLDLPADDKDAALAIVEFAQQNSEKRLSPREKLELVAEMEALVAKARGRSE